MKDAKFQHFYSSWHKFGTEVDPINQLYDFQQNGNRGLFVLWLSSEIWRNAPLINLNCPGLFYLAMMYLQTFLLKWLAHLYQY
ncbi:hypothetical protein X975_07231, partial [Stegodyphus mimosarum]